MTEIAKVLFVGLGGAGQRHMRVIAKAFPQAKLWAYRRTKKTPLLNPNFTVNESGDLEKQYQLKMVKDLEEGLAQKPDLVVISTPTSMHMEPAIKALEAGASVLVEKPFSHDLEGFKNLENLAHQKNLAIWTSYQRRFNPHFQKIKTLIQNNSLGKISSVSIQVSSYLPDWHKYEDFKQMYASRPELGGGVLLTEIHEIDLCCWFFGLPQSVYCSGGSFSGADLLVEDTAAIILNYDKFIVSLTLGFMNKKTGREISINGSKQSLCWNESQNTLTTFNHESGKSEQLSAPFSGPDELFEKQLQDFVSRPLNFNQEDLFKAKASVQVVTAALESMKSGKQVRL